MTPLEELSLRTPVCEFLYQSHDVIEAAIGEPGIAFAREPERLYPQASLAAHVLGYVDMDGRAVTGMEKVLEPTTLFDPAFTFSPANRSEM